MKLTKFRGLLQLEIKPKQTIFDNIKDLPPPQSEGHWNVIERIGIA